MPNDKEKLLEEMRALRAQLESANVLLYKKNCALGRAETIINDLQSQLTQRTAELEAANQHCYADLLAKYQNLVAWYDKQNGTPCEQVRHKQEVADLQAELERVRALVKALPKVEGEIRVIEVATDEWHVYDTIFATKAGADNYAALLQHRQGMEG